MFNVARIKYVINFGFGVSRADMQCKNIYLYFPRSKSINTKFASSTSATVRLLPFTNFAISCIIFCVYKNASILMNVLRATGNRPTLPTLFACRKKKSYKKLFQFQFHHSQYESVFCVWNFFVPQFVGQLKCIDVNGIR